MDQGVEECTPIALGQDKRLMLGDCPTCRIGERCNAEIGDFATLKMSGAFDKFLRFLVHPKPKPFRSDRRIVFEFCLFAGHDRTSTKIVR
jgi:hypothetical protein